MIRDNKWINQFRDIQNRIGNLKESQEITIADYDYYYIYQDKNENKRYEKEGFEFENVIHCLLNKLFCDDIIDNIQIEELDNNNQEKLKMNINLNNKQIELNILGTKKQIMNFYKIYQINEKNNYEMKQKRLLRK